jgi:hypothetical protein
MNHCHWPRSNAVVLLLHAGLATLIITEPFIMAKGIDNTDAF